MAKLERVVYQNGAHSIIVRGETAQEKEHMASMIELSKGKLYSLHIVRSMLDTSCGPHAMQFITVEKTTIDSLFDLDAIRKESEAVKDILAKMGEQVNATVVKAMSDYASGLQVRINMLERRCVMLSEELDVSNQAAYDLRDTQTKLSDDIAKRQETIEALKNELHEAYCTIAELKTSNVKLKGAERKSDIISSLSMADVHQPAADMMAGTIARITVENNVLKAEKAILKGQCEFLENKLAEVDTACQILQLKKDLSAQHHNQLLEKVRHVKDVLS